jgi:hypothetical protein
MTKRAWNELVTMIEEEVAQSGPAQIDERKLRFLQVAYLRDIRDQIAKINAVRPIVQPPTRSSWDMEEQQEDSGDTRPFRFSDELRIPRPVEVQAEDGRRDKPAPKKPR